MTSTNDGKEVKSNQTSGQKGKSHYIELYKTLDAGLSSECSLGQRTQHLCEAWRRVHSLCQHSAPPTHTHLLSWLQRHTAKTVLQTEWQSPNSENEHRILGEAISSFVQDCTSAIAGRDGQSPPWESQLLQRAEWFITVLPNPWGHEVLKVLLQGETVEDDELLGWLKEERGVMFVTRLRQLASSKCNDLALRLASVVMDKIRDCAEAVSDQEQSDGTKGYQKAENKEPTFEDILRTEAGFTVEVWELLTDIEFVLLHKSDRRSECIELAKKTPLRNGYQLVERLQSRLETSPREKKLWKNAKEVATLIAQVVIARCMVLPTCSGVSRTALYCCTRSLARLLPRAKLPAATHALAAPASTARHLHTMVSAIHAQSTDEMKPFVSELYVRAITSGMNELERLKLKPEKEAEARVAAQTLASWFVQLGALLAECARVRCECVLTAFSLHPSPAMYERVQATPLLPPVAAGELQEPKHETTSEFGSWANDSRSQTNFVKTSQTLNLKRTQQQTNVLSTAILTEGEALGLSPEMCQDIAVLLSGPRQKTLSWDMDRELLLENCRTYMERTGGGTRALTTELKYLNLDLSRFQHLPEEEDDENDVYYGIEKGYEHLVEFQEAQPEQVWDDVIWDDEQTESTYSDSTDSMTGVPQRKKKTKQIGIASECDSDPLSLFAEAKKKKERPHSKERSKDSKKKTPKDPSQKEHSRDRRKEEKKTKKKEKKERQKKQNVQEDVQGPPGTLSRLVGVKVVKVIPNDTNQTKDAAEIKLNNSITDSDYDSQGKSSLNSDPPDVLYDGQFSMDEIKSPERTTLPGAENAPNISKTKELISKGVPSNKPRVLSTPMAQSKNILHPNIPLSGYVGNVVKDLKLNEQTPKTAQEVKEEVKRSISRLIQFRRQKLSNSDDSNSMSPSRSPNVPSTARAPLLQDNLRSKPELSALIGSRIAKPAQESRVLMTKKQTEQLSVLTQEVNDLLARTSNTSSGKSYAIKKAPHKIDATQTCSRVQPVNFTYTRKTPAIQTQNSSAQNTPLPTPPYAHIQNQQPYRNPTPQPQKSYVDTHQKSFQEFLKDLQSCNAELLNPTQKTAKRPPPVKKEMKPVSRVTPVIPNAAPKITEPSPPPQCAKPIQPRKSDNAPNTFARLSYMHKNKTKQPVDQKQMTLQNSVSEELDKRIADLRLGKMKCMQTSGDLIISRVKHLGLNTKTQETTRVEIKKVEKTSTPKSDYTLVTNMLYGNDLHMPIQKEKQPSIVPIEKPRLWTPKPSKSTSLSEKDQHDLLLLLRQQSKLNSPIVPPNHAEASSKQMSNNALAQNNPVTYKSQNNPVNYKLPTKIPNIAAPYNLESKHFGLSIQSNTNIKTPAVPINMKVNATDVIQNKANIIPQTVSPSSGRPTPSHSKYEVAEPIKITKPVLERDMDILKKTSKSSHTKQNNDQQEWAKVLDAIRAQKTPSRGPTALDMVLKKDVYEKFTNESLRNQRIVKTNTGDTKLATTAVNTNQKEVTEPPFVIMTPIKTVIEQPIKSDKPKKPRRPTVKRTKLVEPPKLSFSDAYQKITCGMQKADNFASSIPNSDYDLIEELMDDDLRQEIGELMSDDESYRSTGTTPKDLKTSVKTGNDVLNEPMTLPAREKPKLIDTKCLNSVKNICVENKPVVTIPTSCNPVKDETKLSNVKIDSRSKPLFISNVVLKNPTPPEPPVRSSTIHHMPNKIVLPPSMSEKSIYNMNNNNVVTNNRIRQTTNNNAAHILITPNIVQPVQNVVVIRPEVVYDPYTAPILPGLRNVSQNAFVQVDNTPNITLYQATQYAAPVVNPVIVGNTITVAVSTNVPTCSFTEPFKTVESVPMKQVDIFVAPSPVNSEAIQVHINEPTCIMKPDIEQEINVGETKPQDHQFVTEKNPKTENKNDFIINRNCEENTIIQVQDKLKPIEPEKIDLSDQLIFGDVSTAFSAVSKENNKTIDSSDQILFGNNTVAPPAVPKESNEDNNSSEHLLFGNISNASPPLANENNEKHDQRLKNKRTALINREIEKNINFSPIALSYTPLIIPKNSIQLDGVTLSDNKSSNKSIYNHKLQTKLEDKITYLTNTEKSFDAKLSADTASLTSNFNVDNITSRTNLQESEEIKHNPLLPYRRILLRSSNKLKEKTTQPASAEKSGRKTKVRLKPNNRFDIKSDVLTDVSENADVKDINGFNKNDFVDQENNIDKQENMKSDFNLDKNTEIFQGPQAVTDKQEDTKSDLKIDNDTEILQEPQAITDKQVDRKPDLKINNDTKILQEPQAITDNQEVTMIGQRHPISTRKSKRIINRKLKKTGEENQTDTNKLTPELGIAQKHRIVRNDNLNNDAGTIKTSSKNDELISSEANLALSVDKVPSSDEMGTSLSIHSVDKTAPEGEPVISTQGKVKPIKCIEHVDKEYDNTFLDVADKTKTVSKEHLVQSKNSIDSKNGEVQPEQIYLEESKNDGELIPEIETVTDDVTTTFQESIKCTNISPESQSETSKPLIYDKFKNMSKLVQDMESAIHEITSSTLIDKSIENLPLRLPVLKAKKNPQTDVISILTSKLISDLTESTTEQTIHGNIKKHQDKIILGKSLISQTCSQPSIVSEKSFVSNDKGNIKSKSTIKSNSTITIDNSMKMVTTSDLKPKPPEKRFGNKVPKSGSPITINKPASRPQSASYASIQKNGNINLKSSSDANVNNLHIPQSYKDGIVFEEIPNASDSKFQKTIRIKLPNRKVFKAKISGTCDVNLDSICSNPTLRKILLNDISDKKRFLFNMEQSSTDSNIMSTRIINTEKRSINTLLPKNKNEAVPETINLVSDDEDDDTCKNLITADTYQTFTTECGNYKIRSLDKNTFEKHQKKFSQKCQIKLRKVLEKSVPSIDDKILHTPADGVNMTITTARIAETKVKMIKTPVKAADVIEIDDSSDDSMDASITISDSTTKPQPVKVIDLLKSMVLKDLGVDDAEVDLEKSKSDTKQICDEVQEKNTRKAICSKGEAQDNNNFDLQRQLSECIKRKCVVPLIRCDKMLRNTCKDSYEDDNDELIPSFDSSEFDKLKGELSRSGSFSILNDLALYDDENNHESPNEDLLSRSSPVMDVLDTIVSLRNQHAPGRSSPVMKVFDVIAALHNKMQHSVDSHINVAESVSLASEPDETINSSLSPLSNIITTNSLFTFSSDENVDNDVSTDCESDHDITFCSEDGTGSETIQSSNVPSLISIMTKYFRVNDIVDQLKIACEMIATPPVNTQSVSLKRKLSQAPSSVANKAFKFKVDPFWKDCYKKECNIDSTEPEQDKASDNIHTYMEDNLSKLNKKSKCKNSKFLDTLETHDVDSNEKRNGDDAKKINVEIVENVLKQNEERSKSTVENMTVTENVTVSTDEYNEINIHKEIELIDCSDITKTPEENEIIENFPEHKVIMPVDIPQLPLKHVIIQTNYNENDPLSDQSKVSMESPKDLVSETYDLNTKNALNNDENNDEQKSDKVFDIITSGDTFEHYSPYIDSCNDKMEIADSKELQTDYKDKLKNIEGTNATSECVSSKFFNHNTVNEDFREEFKDEDHSEVINSGSVLEEVRDFKQIFHIDHEKQDIVVNLDNFKTFTNCETSENAVERVIKHINPENKNYIKSNEKIDESLSPRESTQNDLIDDNLTINDCDYNNENEVCTSVGDVNSVDTTQTKESRRDTTKDKDINDIAFDNFNSCNTPVHDKSFEEVLLDEVVPEREKKPIVLINNPPLHVNIDVYYTKFEGLSEEVTVKHEPVVSSNISPIHVATVGRDYTFTRSVCEDISVEQNEDVKSVVPFINTSISLPEELAIEDKEDIEVQKIETLMHVDTDIHENTLLKGVCEELTINTSVYVHTNNNILEEGILSEEIAVDHNCGKPVVPVISAPTNLDIIVDEITSAKGVLCEELSIEQNATVDEDIKIGKNITFERYNTCDTSEPEHLNNDDKPVDSFTSTPVHFHTGVQDFETGVLSEKSTIEYNTDTKRDVPLINTPSQVLTDIHENPSEKEVLSEGVPVEHNIDVKPVVSVINEHDHDYSCLHDGQTLPKHIHSVESNISSEDLNDLYYVPDGSCSDEELEVLTHFEICNNSNDKIDWLDHESTIGSYIDDLLENSVTTESEIITENKVAIDNKADVDEDTKTEKITVQNDNLAIQTKLTVKTYTKTKYDAIKSSTQDEVKIDDENRLKGFRDKIQIFDKRILKDCKDVPRVNKCYVLLDDILKYPPTNNSFTGVSETNMICEGDIGQENIGQILDDCEVKDTKEIKTEENSYKLETETVDDNNFKTIETECENNSLVLKGIDYGTCYVFPIAKSSDSSGTSELLNEISDSNVQDVDEVDKYDLHHESRDLCDGLDFKLILPKATYSARRLKRKLVLKFSIASKRPRRASRTKSDFLDTKISEKRYRKGKNIDYPKFSEAAITEASYVKEYKRLIDYFTSVEFSYSLPFHKEQIEVEDLLKDWPINKDHNDSILTLEENEIEDVLFVEIEDHKKIASNPMDQTLAEEINEPEQTEYYSSEIEETNFSMGFGEGSDRVIQNLEDVGAISKFSAATLSDVKQTQPCLLSEVCNSKNYNNILQSSIDDQINKIKRYMNYIRLREQVRMFFQSTKFGYLPGCRKESTDAENRLRNTKASSFPFHLYTSLCFEPLPVETVVQVVQVGQLPVSAAAQNPVTCDPRVTHVSDASPSQCSAENSPNDDSQATIKTEYTELTTADLTLPLVQDYSQHAQSIAMESQRNTNLTSDENIPIETEIKSEVKVELDEEPLDVKEEPNVCNDDIKLEDIVNEQVNDVEYRFETCGTDASTNIEPDDNAQMLFSPPENQTISESYSPPENQTIPESYSPPENQSVPEAYSPPRKQQNGAPEKTDQIAHAMNAAGITTTPEPTMSEPATNTTRAHALVNILSQKMRPSAVTTTPNAVNTYPKTTSINAMALQQALAQILPPPLNQTTSTDTHNQPNQNAVTPQVLHIVQGKNAAGNQITLVDNTQQSVITTQNATPVLHIVQNKAPATVPTSNGTSPPQQNTFSGISLVDAGLQQGGNQLLHIVNTGSQKNNNAGQLLKRVNLLTNLTNVQGSNEQKMVQFVCKSADGKAIQLNAPHQRSMVLRLQPIDTSNVQPATPKPVENQDLCPSPNSGNIPQNKDSASQQEIKSRSVYEENYAKFIQNSSTKPNVLEKSTSLPKFNQAFGKPVFQDGSQKQNELNGNNSHLQTISPSSENVDCPPTESINLDHINQIGSPPMLLRKPTCLSSQSQSNIVQQIKQTIAPMNIQTMHGGVIYTRQIPVNIGGGQTINLITVPSTELIDESGQKQSSDVKFVNQGDIEQSIIKIVPQSQSTSNSEANSDDGHPHIGVSNENPPAPQPQPVLTQMRIKLPMLSKAPQMVSGARVVRPSFFQIQRNVIGGANQPVYQQLVLTAAPPIGQQTIRLPQAQARQIKVPTESQSSTESQMSSSTLEQLREFDMVLEQVKERSTVQPSSASNSSFKCHTPSTDTTDNPVTASSTVTETTQQVLYSIGGNQPLNVAYVNRKSTVTTPTTSTFVRSPDSSGIADSPSSSTHVPIPQTVTAETTVVEPPAQPKPAKVSSKSKSRPKSSHSSNSMKINSVPPKTSTQKPLEDEQTTQRILYILAEYKEQVENSPDKDKPAPRRRSNPPSNPSGSSKRKKGSRRSGVRELSPIHGDDTCRTMGSEDSSCGTSQGDCTESCLETHSPQDSPRKVVRKLTFEQDPPILQPRPQPQRNVIVADGQTITVARGTSGKPTTAVLMPANYILPVSMVKGGQQIAIVTNRGPKLLTVGGGEGGATNALLLQRLIGPAGLKPVLARPGVRHVRLPTAALHNLQAFNLAAASSVQPPDSTASPASAPTPPDLVETQATSSPWAEREMDNAKQPERGSSPEGSEPWNLPSSADPNDYSYEETVRAEQLERTVLVVQKKDGRQHRLAHVSAAALRHKYAILEHELRLQKSLSEECEDLGVDSPSAAELFPEAELLFAASPAHDHAAEPTHSHQHPHPHQHPHQRAHTPQPLLNQTCIQHEMEDQIATDQLIPREIPERQELDVNLGLEDVGIVTVSEDGMQATIALDQEEFARAHPNTTFHREPSEEVVQPYTITGLKGRHITSTIFHSSRAPATVLMTAPQATVISQAAAETTNHVKYADIDNMINSIPETHANNLNLASVLVKDDRLTRYDNILNDTRELHLSNTASAIVHSAGNATQVIRRVCYEDDKRDRFLLDEPDTIIAGNDAKMVAEDASREAALRSMVDVDDMNSSPERHAELFWESNSASERSESRRPLDFSSDSDKCCKSPSYDETNSTDSSGVGAHMRLDSVIKDARGIDRSGSAEGSSADDTHPPLRTYPAKRVYHPMEGDMARSLSGKTRAGERSPDNMEVRRRASGRGVVKRGCHCCNGSPAPSRPKKPRQRKPTMDFTTN